MWFSTVITLPFIDMTCICAIHLITRFDSVTITGIIVYETVNQERHSSHLSSLTTPARILFSHSNFAELFVSNRCDRCLPQQVWCGDNQWDGFLERWDASWGLLFFFGSCTLFLSPIPAHSTFYQYFASGIVRVLSITKKSFRIISRIAFAKVFFDSRIINWKRFSTFGRWWHCLCFKIFFFFGLTLMPLFPGPACRSLTMLCDLFLHSQLILLLC